MIKCPCLTLFLGVCIFFSAAGNYTNPARLEEVRKKIEPVDEEKSGDKEKAADKKRRYEQSERKRKYTNEKQEVIERIEAAEYLSD